jgi:hypothetical protein
MTTSEDEGLLEQAARREAGAVRVDVWVAIAVVTAWTGVVALVAGALAGGGS